MDCTSCGNGLTPGMPYCPRCGASTATTAVPPEALPTGEAEKRALDGKADGWKTLSYEGGIHRQPRTAFYGRYGGRPTFAPPAPSSLSHTSTATDTLAPPTPGQMEGTRGLPDAVSPAGAAPGSTPAMLPAEPKTAAPSRRAPPARPKRPLIGRLITLAAILLLLALLTGLGTIGYRDYKNNQGEARATATASARSNATATANAQARATATAPLFIDSLSSNTNGWSEDGTTSFFQGNQYHLHDPDPNQTLNSYYQGQTFSDFQAEVTITNHADANAGSPVPYAAGLVLRADPNTPSDKYAFFVSPNGTYDFAYHDVNNFNNNGWNDLLSAPWATSSALHTGEGATNTLKVIAIGSSFTLFINGQQVAQVTDTNGGNTSGWIGLLVEGADMEAGFSNLRVSGPGL